MGETVKLSKSDLSELADLAIEAATNAGKMVASSRPENVERKADGASLASQVVTEIDRRAEDMILEHLNPTLDKFELGLLTEEQDDDGSRFTTDYFWCIDPIDGTLPFIEGTSGYAVAIALVGRDGTPWIGVIYDPVDGVLFHAVKGAGAFRDRQRWLDQVPAESLSVFVDRSFETSNDRGKRTAALEQIASDMDLAGVQLHAVGGAVMSACAVLSNAPACYFKFAKPTGGGSLWDFAATACLFNEMGAIATDMSGDPLDLNRADSLLMHHRGVLFATKETLAARIRALA